MTKCVADEAIIYVIESVQEQALQLKLSSFAI